MAEKFERLPKGWEDDWRAVRGLEHDEDDIEDEEEGDVSDAELS